jgi:septal ring factor EnvC (AmiA/AmiB activator)
MQAIPPSSFLLRSIVLATLGLLPLGLMAASAQTSRTRTPAPADAHRPASPPASLDMLKERDEELEKLRAEQRRILENEAKLKREIESIGDDRRKFNEQIIETAARVVDVEERAARTQERLDVLDDKEQALRTSLQERRGLIAEVLAALQRIGRQTPPALMIRAEDALQSVRSAMMLGAVLPEMRHQAEVLATDLAELVRLRTQIADERSRLARDLLVLVDERQRLSLFIDERQKRLAEAERTLGEERQNAAVLAVNLSSGSSRASTAPRVRRGPRRAPATIKKGRARGLISPHSRIPGGSALPFPSLQPRECCRFRSMARKYANSAPRTASEARKRAYPSPPGPRAKSRPRATDGWYMPDPSAIMANS